MCCDVSGSEAAERQRAAAGGESDGSGAAAQVHRVVLQHHRPEVTGEAHASLRTCG